VIEQIYFLFFFPLRSILFRTETQFGMSSLNKTTVFEIWFLKKTWMVVCCLLMALIYRVLTSAVTPPVLPAPCLHRLVPAYLARGQAARGQQRPSTRLPLLACCRLPRPRPTDVLLNLQLLACPLADAPATNAN
jgi:hypothetical protein